MNTERNEGTYLPYYMSSALCGFVLGLLFAPKKGGELRADIRETGDRLYDTIKDAIPGRVKTAAVIGAAKGAGQQVLHHKFQAHRAETSRARRHARK